jgi:hypothetical protein
LEQLELGPPTPSRSTAICTISCCSFLPSWISPPRICSFLSASHWESKCPHLAECGQ